MSEKPPLITGMEWDEGDFWDAHKAFMDKLRPVVTAQFPEATEHWGGEVAKPEIKGRRFLYTVVIRDEYPYAHIDLPIGVIVAPDGVEQVIDALIKAVEELKNETD